jgi:hypothetical protein
MGVGKPGVEGPHGHLDGEAQEHPGEDDQLDALGERRGGGLLLQGDDVEGVGVRLEEHGQEPQQHEHAAEQGVQEELDGRVLAVRRAPHRDQEIHGNQNQLPEDEEQDEVERDERAGHPSLEQHHQGQEGLGPARVGQEPPRVDSAQERQQERQLEQGKADPVDSDVIAGVDRRDPIDIELELQTLGRAVVEAEQHDDPHDQGRPGEQDAQRTDQPVGLLRHQRDDQSPGRR